MDIKASDLAQQINVTIYMGTCLPCYTVAIEFDFNCYSNVKVHMCGQELCIELRNVGLISCPIN